MKAKDVLAFWFEETKPEQWFKKDLQFDELIKSKFKETLEAARKGELYEWREYAPGRLAEIIVLDQFSRNIFRNSPDAFAADSLALVLAQEMVSLKLDKEISLTRRAFVYMPYMHSESLKIHEVAVGLFDQEGLEDNYKFELLHKDVIEKFGRYPSRNEALGRVSTAEEIEFLKVHPGF